MEWTLDFRMGEPLADPLQTTIFVCVSVNIYGCNMANVTIREQLSGVGSLSTM